MKKTASTNPRKMAQAFLARKVSERKARTAPAAPVQPPPPPPAAKPEVTPEVAAKRSSAALAAWATRRKLNPAKFPTPGQPAAAVPPPPAPAAAPAKPKANGKPAARRKAS